MSCGTSFPIARRSRKRAAQPDSANKEIRDNLRRLLPSNIFVQILAGPPELRTGIFGSMLQLIAVTTLIVFPILLLFQLQIQFLPFHDVRITWIQRDALLLDIVVLWVLRPPILADLSVESAGRARLLSKILRGICLVLAGVLSALALWFSIVVATIPGEWQETALAALDRPLWQVSYAEPDKLVSTHELLFAGPVNISTRRRMSLFTNTLVLPGFNLFEALKSDDPKKLLPLRGRHLEQAVLYGANLTKAQLFGAYLHGELLDNAQLQGASLSYAQLRGASLNNTNLQGASLVHAELQGASLVGAQLQGASFDYAQLQGASLNFGQLLGASFNSADLKGASLNFAQLQGVSLDSAMLQGALLVEAELQGAWLVGAEVRATDFSGAFLWRTQWGEIDPERLVAVRVKDATWKPIIWSPKDKSIIPWDAKAYAELRDDLINSVPEGKMREAALRRIETLDCTNPDKTLVSCDPAAKPPPEVLDWQKTLSTASVDEAAYAKGLAGESLSLVCAKDDNAIHNLRGIIVNVRLLQTDREAPRLVDYIMSKNCPVSAALSDDDKAKLLAIKQDAEEKNSRLHRNRRKRSEPAIASPELAQPVKSFKISRNFRRQEEDFLTSGDGLR